MSLKVWLPLLGNLNNQGVSNITIENRGAVTANSAGKIGQCMSFNGTGTSNIRLPAILKNTDDFSITCWVKFNTTVNQCLFSQRTAANAAGFTIFYLNGTDIRFDEGVSVSAGGTVSANTWYHIACCRDSAKTYIYINGVYKGGGNRSNTSASNVNANYSFIGGSQNDAAGSTTQTNANMLNGYLNDYRIYDHCLSAAEVREISQGLVLHYKLDDNVQTISNAYNMTSWNTNTDNGGFSTWGPSGHSGTKGINTDRQYIYSPDRSYSYWFAHGVNADTSKYYIFYQSPGFAGGYRSLSCIVKEENSLPIDDAWFMPGWNANVVGEGHAPVSTWTHKYPLGNGFYLCQVDGLYQDGSNDLVCLTVNNGHKIYVSEIWLENNKQVASNPLFRANQIQDSSGYGHNGTIIGTPMLSSDTPRYSASMVFDGASSIACGRGGMVKDALTINLWVNKTTWNTTNARPVSCTESGGWNFEANGDYIQFQCGTGASGNTYRAIKSSVTWASLSTGWHMFTGTYDGFCSKIYIDGVLKGTGSSYETKTPVFYHSSNGIFLAAEAGGSATTPAGTYFDGSLSDFRIYCTALDAAAVKQLYELGAKVDNKGNLHTFELNEQMPNILFNIEKARTDLTFSNGLSRYTQSNCQVTLTDNGYRIYRPPNLNPTNNGNTMYGGLKLVNQSTDSVSPYNASRDNVWGLQTGHSYMLAFHIKGVSSGVVGTMGFTNNMGWGVGGVSPTPTVIVSRPITANFNGEQDCFYLFTINDAIIKTSNDARGGYDGSSNYLSYRYFAFNWGYSNTGTNGTDVYLTNFRLYDITNHMAKFTKTGQATFFSFVEQMNKCAIRKNSELLATEFIEL